MAVVDDVINSGATIKEIVKWMRTLYNTSDIVCFVVLDVRKMKQIPASDVVSIYRVKESNGGSAYLAADLIDEFDDLKEFLRNN